MASRAGLLSDFLELLNIHRAIGCRRHFNKMPQQPRHVKTCKTRLRHGAYLELSDFLPRPLIAVLFRYTRAIWAFRFLERLFA